MMLFSMSAHAFFERMVDGMTRVTSKLIDSSEKVAIHGMNTTSTTILLLSNDIGKMADRMVYTERMMSDFAHRLVDTGAVLARGADAARDPGSRQLQLVRCRASDTRVLKGRLPHMQHGRG